MSTFHAPWSMCPKLSASENHKGFRISDDRGHWIADVSPRDQDGTEGRKHAHLMAAAPELYAALKWVIDSRQVGYTQRLAGQNDEHCDRVDDAIRAIRKAEGLEVA